jgi:indole-3-glycerol phosphate synthase
VIVSESGIATPEDIRRLRDVGASGFLIGESLLRQDDPGEAARKLLSGV